MRLHQGKGIALAPALCPVPVAVGLGAVRPPLGVGDRIMPRIPLRRWGEPEDWAGIAVYLASKASSFHSGDAFRIDGGYGVF